MREWFIVGARPSAMGPKPVKDRSTLDKTFAEAMRSKQFLNGI